MILPINEEIPSQIHDIISEGWSSDKKRRFNTQLIFLRLANVCPGDDYQFLQYEDSMSSATSMCTLSETSNTSHHNETCSSSHTSSTCSLHHVSTNNGNSYTECDFNNDFWKRLKLQRYVQELEFGKLIYGEKIGEGHYGTVRKGEIEFYDPVKPPCKVAIKTLKDTCNIKTTDDFRQEIDIMKVSILFGLYIFILLLFTLQKLNHKNIVKIISSIYKPEITIIMEYIESNSFKVFLSSEKNLKERRLLKFALDVAEVCNLYS